MTTRRLAAIAAALVLVIGAAFAGIAALTRDPSPPSGSPTPPAAAPAPAPDGPTAAPPGTPSVPPVAPPGATPPVSNTSRAAPPASTTGKPEFAGVEPRSGPAAGGGQVVIRGSNLAGVAQVLFGSAPARIAARSEGALTIDVPAGSPGVVTLVLTSVDGSYAVAPGVYTYR